MPSYQRPNIPYTPTEALPNNNRYALMTAANQPPTAADFDGEFNYVIDSCNALNAAISGVAAGILPGSNDPNNVNKFPVTNGETPATISWTQVLTQHIANNAVATQNIAPNAITTEKLGPGAVQADNIYPNTITAQQVANGTLTGAQMAVNSISGSQIALGTIEAQNVALGTLTGAQMAPRSVSGAQLALGTVDNSNLAPQAVAPANLAPVLVPPVGMIIDYASYVAPTGWLVCDGSTVSRATYAGLFAAIGTNYGAGDGSTTFNLPDCRGRTTVGIDLANQGSPAATDYRVQYTANAYVSGGYGGEELHTLTVNEIPGHTHTVTGMVGQQDAGGAGIGYVPGGSNTTSTTGGGQGHNNMPPYIFFIKLIYAGV